MTEKLKKLSRMVPLSSLLLFVAGSILSQLAIYISCDNKEFSKDKIFLICSQACYLLSYFACIMKRKKEQNTESPQTVILPPCDFDQGSVLASNPVLQYINPGPNFDQPFISPPNPVPPFEV